MTARLAPPAGVALVVLALAATTLMPGLGFWDTAELQTVAPLMGTAHPTGFPTYVLLGWLASVVLQPLGEEAFRMNVFAAISVAAAAGVLVDLVRVLTRSPWLGVAAGLGFGLSPLAWGVSTHAEAHALHIALVAVLLRLLVGWADRRRAGSPRADRWLVAAAVAFAVAAGNHSLTLLLAPAIGAYVLAVEPAILRRPRLVAAAAGALAATLALVYLELPLRAGPFRAPLVYGHPETWDGFWAIVLAEQFRGSLGDPFADLPGLAARLAALGAAQLGPLVALVPAALAVTAVRRPAWALLTGLAFVVTVLFAGAYDNADIGRYYLGPLLVAWTWLGVLAGAAADAVADLLQRGVDRPPGRLRFGATGLAALLLAVPTVAATPDRQAAVDESDDVAAPRWVDAVLAQVDRDAVVVSWWSLSTPLWYAQHVEGRRPDIDIVDDRTRLDRGLGDVFDVIEANLGRRPVYVTRTDPAELRRLEEDYIIETLDLPWPGSLVEVVGRRGAGT